MSVGWTCSILLKIYHHAVTMCGPGRLKLWKKKTNERFIQYNLQLLQTVSKRRKQRQWSHFIFLPNTPDSLSLYFYFLCLLLRFAIHELLGKQIYFDANDTFCFFLSSNMFQCDSSYCVFFAHRATKSAYNFKIALLQ